MESGSQKDEAEQPSGSWWLVLLVGVVVFFTLMYIFPDGNISRQKGLESRVIPKETTLPELQVAGWLNKEGGSYTDKEIRGKIVVIDCWASWCGPCRKKMPSLAKIYNRIKSPQVVMLGLTPESVSEVGTVQAYMDSVPGFDWPVGYGATPVLQQLQVPGYPTLIIFDTLGNAVWSSHGLEGLEEKIIQLMASQPTDEPLSPPASEDSAEISNKQAEAPSR